MDLSAEITEQADLITENNDLRTYLFMAIGIASLAAVSLVFMIVRQRGKRQILAESMLPTDTHEKKRRDLLQEIEELKESLNINRAKLVKYEVQKKELLAYIEELKSVQGETKALSKTNQIQRILNEQKNQNIVSKVEGAARTLYPELIDALNERYPELNQLEQQYCMMMALGYNLDEVISILGRTEKAIKSLRYRIRKKMELDDSQSLREHILELNEKEA